MKELNARPDGTKYVPIVYDVFMHREKSDNECNKESGKLTVFIVMEYFEKDLKSFIEKKLKDLEDKKLLKLLQDCLQAIQFLHQHNVVHRDIKPDNIFITDDLQVKIGDFGISRSLPQNLTGKGSGNSLRVRNYIRRYEINDSEFNQSET